MSLRSDMIDTLAKNLFETAALYKYQHAGYTWDEISDVSKDAIRHQVTGTVDLLTPVVARYVGERTHA